jgi:hypothetical protein
MTDTPAVKVNSNPPAEGLPPAKSEVSSPLQWVREGIAAVISIAILVVTVLMMYGTYSYAAKESPANADANAAIVRKESYDRQKDIMLYALALLGTVTGYYLGRVPAELHAQQAQQSANTAQEQLQKTQTKLTDTAGQAAEAATQVSIAQNEKHAAQTKLSKAADALETSQVAISKTLSNIPKTLGDSAAGPGTAGVADLRRAQEEIERTLRELRGA